MTKPTVLTVILNFRTAAMTIKAAEAALREMHDMPGTLLIVDNDSGDGSFEALQKAVKEQSWVSPRVQVLQTGHNGGFGAGNNFGIRHGFSQGIDGKVPDYVYILNSDAFPEEGAISILCQHLEHNPKTGLAGSYIHGPDGDAHLTAFRFPSVLGELEGAARFGPISRLLKRSIVPLPIPEATCSVDWLAGASMMIRGQVLQEIGLFDEAFFLYFEETDLCRRAARAGWLTDYVRDSSVMHIGSVSTGMKTWERIPQFWLDSRQHYFRRNHGRAYEICATLAHLLGGCIPRLRGLFQGNSISQPKYFLNDLAFHALRTAVKGNSNRPRQISFPKGLSPLNGEQA
ncbi:glycosyltransferase family 2 protein [Cognatishimia sp. WU-CL00825]|uniref:glycosyltransferase family 2 protein n=1 Tax=Cognatishimia sp. WU-CL00825 TaxID=3127658 RepID=UPI00310B4127